MVFVVINDDSKTYTHNLSTHNAFNMLAKDAIMYTGSTTGVKFNNLMCSPYQVSWHVDRKCHLVCVCVCVHTQCAGPSFLLSRGMRHICVQSHVGLATWRSVMSRKLVAASTDVCVYIHSVYMCKYNIHLLSLYLSVYLI